MHKNKQKITGTSLDPNPPNCFLSKSLTINHAHGKDENDGGCDDDYDIDFHDDHLKQSEQ